MGLTVSITIILVIALAVFLSGIRIVRPTERGLIETLGKYTKVAVCGWKPPAAISTQIASVQRLTFCGIVSAA